MSVINPNSISREEYLRKKRNKKVFKFSVISFFILLVVISALFFLWRDNARINQINLSGGVLVSQDEIKETTNEFLSGSIYVIFPKNSVFFYPEYELKSYLSQIYRRIETIEIEISGTTKMQIKITERKPIAIWCDEFSSDQNTKCYFIDKNGTIFANAPQFSESVYFKYYGIVNKEHPIGNNYLPSAEKFSEINEFIEKIKKLSLKPLYLVAKEEGEFTLLLFGGAEIYFDSKRKMDEVYTNLKLLLENGEVKISEGILKASYVDLRYGNKLFYK